MSQTIISQDCLALCDITKNFVSGGRSITVLNGVNYSFDPGKSYAIIGASGSGKSTALHILAGFEPPTKGKVLWQGASLDELTNEQKNAFVAHQLGFVFQFHYLIKELTVFQNVFLAGMIQKIESSECEKQAIGLLHEVGLAEKVKAYPGELSGGQQQRVAVARAMMGRPSFLLADEPTGNLDAQTAQQVMELCLMYHKKQGMGLIIATHDATIYEKVDIVLQLKNGRFEVM